MLVRDLYKMIYINVRMICKSYIRVWLSPSPLEKFFFQNILFMIKTLKNSQFNGNEIDA